jgi:hypothetical protein
MGLRKLHAAETAVEIAVETAAETAACDCDSQVRCYYTCDYPGKTVGDDNSQSRAELASE